MSGASTSTVRPVIRCTMSRTSEGPACERVSISSPEEAARILVGLVTLNSVNNAGVTDNVLVSSDQFTITNAIVEGTRACNTAEKPDVASSNAIDPIPEPCKRTLRTSLVAMPIFAHGPHWTLKHAWPRDRRAAIDEKNTQHARGVVMKASWTCQAPTAFGAYARRIDDHV
eukprot:scaffold281896_cov34-Tisochrysis_lutea.AAC.7